jgi:tetratricopeptide (TPR) repeat protein
VTAIERASAALAIHEKLGDLEQQCIDLGNIGAYHSEAGNAGEARQYLERTLGIAEQLHDEVEIARSSFNLGLLLSRHSSTRAQALPYYERAYEITSRVGHTTGALLSLSALGELQASLGERQLAFGLLADSLDLAVASRSDIHVPEVLVALAECALEAGELEAARVFAATADVMREHQGSTWGDPDASFQLELRERMGLLPAETFATARPIDDCLALARELVPAR